MSEETSHKKNWLIEIIPQICQRPRMYTIGGTFREVYNFLSGVDFGRANGGPRTTEWMDFTNWLRTKKSFPMNTDFYGVVREYSDDDTAVLQLLQKLFERFAEERSV